MRIRRITLKGREFDVSDQGEIWRVAYTNGRGQFFPQRKVKVSPNKRGYTSIYFKPPNRKACKLSVHRIVAQAFLTDYSESLWVDHCNGIRSDNRLENLRMVTPQGNHRGRYRKIAGTHSRYRGVTWEHGRHKWKAAICINDKRINIGRFGKETDAARAWDAAALKAGFFTEALNFPKNYGNSQNT